MAKTQTYRDDLLVEAVERYATQYGGKIKATELAKWARKNIPELESVKDYHFVRSSMVRDPKTGKKVPIERPSGKRINEINQSRMVASGIEANPLLRSSDIDAFLKLPLNEQRKVIVAAREQMDALISRNIYLEREHKILLAEQGRIEERLTSIDERIFEISDAEKTLSLTMKHLTAVTDEKLRQEALAMIGITDDYISLKKNVESLSVKITEIFSIRDSIKGIMKKTDSENELIDSVMDGIDF
ncbi:MAG: hypothetical protein IJO13_05755 [Lachnospiraceae bacterium]|nr:hypothetical protein [Lachnospiraceae bacterium]